VVVVRLLLIHKIDNKIEDLTNKGLYVKGVDPIGFVNNSIKASDNASPELEQLLSKSLRFDDKDQDLIHAIRDLSWEKVNWNKINKTIADNKDAVNKIEGIVLAKNHWLETPSIAPHLANVIELNRILLFNAVHEAKAGNLEKFNKHINCSYRTAMLASDSGFIISQMVAVAMITSCDYIVIRVMKENTGITLSKQNIELISMIRKKELAREAFLNTLHNDIWMYNYPDKVPSVDTYYKESRWDKIWNWFRTWDNEKYFCLLKLMEVNEFIIDYSHNHFHEKPFKRDFYIQAWEGTPVWPYYVAQRWGSVRFSGMFYKELKSDAFSQIVIVEDALIKYKHKKGSYPEKLSQLVPDFINADDLEDTFSGKELVYGKTEKGVIVYNIGDGGLYNDNDSQKGIIGGNNSMHLNYAMGVELRNN